jgi:hypothetical protein
MWLRHRLTLQRQSVLRPRGIRWCCQVSAEGILDYEADLEPRSRIYQDELQPELSPATIAPDSHTEGGWETAVSCDPEGQTMDYHRSFEDAIARLKAEGGTAPSPISSATHAASRSPDGVRRAKRTVREK